MLKTITEWTVGTAFFAALAIDPEPLVSLIIATLGG